jgi:lysozyme
MTALTPRAVAYIAHEEGLVAEAYLDNANPRVWTWALGVTNASGHEVYPRYKDKPQSLAKCVEVSVWLLRNKYVPQVVRAFAGHALTDNQLAAAISFNWNTGAILTASWVRLFKEGKRDEARAAFLSWRKPASIMGRRKREADLFFDGTWPADMRCPVWSVAKPSYSPKGARAVDILPMIEQVMGGS